MRAVLQVTIYFSLQHLSLFPACSLFILLVCNVYEWIPLLLIADDPKVDHQQLEIWHIVHRDKPNIAWKDISEKDLSSLHLKTEDWWYVVNEEN